MKQKEHISNWIGSISLLFSFILIVSLSSANNDAKKADSGAVFKHIESANHAAQSIEPNPDTHHENLFLTNSLSLYSKNNFIDFILFSNSLNNINFVLTKQIYNRQKHKFLFAQLIAIQGNLADFPLIS
jgi:hypothetical protein